MTVTAAQFRSDFPAFASRTKYPDGMLNFWLAQALLWVNISAWGNRLSLGIELFAAHNVVLERQAMDASAVGGIPGVSTGPVSGKSVDKVSINYASGEALDPNASHWNLTTYGTRFIRFAKIVGAGPVQVIGPIGGVNGQDFWFFGPGPYQPTW